ncbi:MAG: peptide chain release factor N(5)-glutamine methyltransferase [candidate division Zixibacteria bacterium]|jgi:release factor glutamine methyltransferase|nr:peptide chain release factor N(5)-glutamine methyltransferase [candidate division Zixibacteria bacterium]
MSEPLSPFITRHAQRLEAVGIDHAANEVEWTLCHLLRVDRLHLYLEGLTQFDDRLRAEFESVMQRRLTREPLQYILQHAPFYGRDFFVSPAVMVPTPETESLCETALGYLDELELEHPRILDVGVGSGVIAVTMAAERPESRVVALDISDDALAVARTNAETHEVLERVEFRRSDLFRSLTPDERFDLILSNPPYIAEPDYADLPPEVRADPKVAMTAGSDGLDIIRRLLADAPDHLARQGRLMFEIGYDQAEKVAALTAADPRYTFLSIIRDLNDIDRIVVLGCDR